MCPSFHCGRLGNISYPFSNYTHPFCGLSLLDCNEPKIQLEKEGTWYNVAGITDKEIRFPYQEFKDNGKTQICDSSYNWLLAISPLISYEVSSPNLTLFKCKPHSRLHEDYFQGFSSYSGCEDHDIYYKYPQQNLPIIPPQCSVIYLPVSKYPSSEANDLSTLLAPEFSLRFHVNDICKDCHKDGRLCRNVKGNAESNAFCCAVAETPHVENKTDWRRKLKIGFGAGVGGVLVTCLIAFIYHRRNKKFSAFSTLLSRKFSKMDLEKGSTYFGLHYFTYNELEDATNNFDPTKEVGDGGFGTVYHGKLRDGRVVAVKRLYENNYKRVEQFMNEVEILSRLRHQNLVSLYGCTSRHSRELLLVYEFVPNGTVADHLHGDRVKPGCLTWPHRMSIAIETATALAYLHASEIIHRDVKTNNILLDNNFHVKVADFGLSRLFPTDVTHVSTAPQGTPGYLDPDYHQCYQLTYKSDVYSFGVVLVELISSKPALDIFRHRHEVKLSNMAIEKIQNHTLHELVDPCLGFESDDEARRRITLVAELAYQCLQLEKEERPSMDEVLEVLRGIESTEMDTTEDRRRATKEYPSTASAGFD
ncbi:hypothetical protein HHK36_030021 [Tetracentron sinense]|uniref:non-specific serine/threonine protein kinase n=1 Tax=Tetracentron sinense TaxID=13715 RepID=A0A835D051_TETSI|nr:hypothetical protein HHK36_030021 [Tetracentron sinense]